MRRRTLSFEGLFVIWVITTVLFMITAPYCFIGHEEKPGLRIAQALFALACLYYLFLASLFLRWLVQPLLELLITIWYSIGALQLLWK